MAWIKTFNESAFRMLLEELILADLKHSQLIYGLSALDLEIGDSHYLGILDLVADLIGIASDQEKDQLVEIYLEFMQKSVEVPISPKVEELRALSRECLAELERIFGPNGDSC